MSVNVWSAALGLRKPSHLPPSQSCAHPAHPILIGEGPQPSPPQTCQPPIHGTSSSPAPVLPVPPHTLTYSDWVLSMAPGTGEHAQKLDLIYDHAAKGSHVILGWIWLIHAFTSAESHAGSLI